MFLSTYFEKEKGKSNLHYFLDWKYILKKQYIGTQSIN